jgi:hypothetical protein
MRKFTYSRQIVTPEGVEVFTASEFDSFEEGQKAVEKGIYDRKLQFPQAEKKNTAVPLPGTVPSTTANPNITSSSNETGGNKKTE